MNNNSNSKPLGLWMATSLVLGNMIGSGVFLLPATLAPYGGISIIGWLVTTVGAIAFALVFSQLAEKYPDTGGLYVYCREGFGEAVGFLLAWSYWMSICIGTAAIAVAFTSYLSFFIPELNTNAFFGASCTLCTLWILAAINAYSIFGGGMTQLITTILKVIPLLLIPAFGLFQMDFSNFVPFNPSTESNLGAIFSTVGLTLWAFLGLECASIPAGSIKNPRRTIPLATILGTVIASIIYITTTITVMGLVKSDVLRHSTAPFIDAAQLLWGPNGGIIIGIGTIIACLGAVNGWILIQGQIAYAMAKDSLLPRVFTKISPHGSPYVAVIVSSAISSVVIFFNYQDGLISMFNLMASFSVTATLMSFLFCAIARILLLAKEHLSFKLALPTITISLFAFIYGIFAIASIEYEVVYWSLIVLLLGLPVYSWVKYNHTA